MTATCCLSLRCRLYLNPYLLDVSQGKKDPEEIPEAENSVM